MAPTHSYCTRTALLVICFASVSASSLEAASASQALVQKLTFPQTLPAQEASDSVPTITLTNMKSTPSDVTLPYKGYLSIIDPEPEPAYHSKKYIVLSFKIQHNHSDILNTDPDADTSITAYEFFSLTDLRQEPLSYWNNCPITAFSFNEQETRMAVKSEKTWYILPTPDANDRALVKKIMISEGPTFSLLALTFIPHTAWFSLQICHSGLIYFYFITLQGDAKLEKFDGQKILKCTYPQATDETPFILIHLENGTSALCYIEGSSIEHVDNNVSEFSWEHNQNKTGYLVKVKKQEAVSEYEVLKTEYRTPTPAIVEEPAPTPPDSSRSNASDSSNTSSANSSPKTPPSIPVQTNTQ